MEATVPVYINFDKTDALSFNGIIWERLNLKTVAGDPGGGFPQKRRVADSPSKKEAPLIRGILRYCPRLLLSEARRPLLDLSFL
jgi:hypothetical protein